MKETKVKKWVGYVRISSDSQMENTSISEQVRQIEAFCVSQGWQLAAIFKDEGVSGSTIERDGYQDMLYYIQQPEHEVGGIVVTKSDRIHRQLNHLLDLIEEELEPNGMAFISVTERMDTSTPQGKIFLQMLGGFAEFERATINERTKNGRIATARKNQYAGGGVPYGYRLLNGNMVLDEQQASIVKHIFQEYVEGTNPYRIAKLLNKAGILTKTGKAWTVVQVTNILRNETYTGFNTYNGQKEQNGIRQKDVFPRIISRQLWNKARQVS
ncbi:MULTISPECIES: recombinase family protein [Brevibacillus]|uniref:recombinase family protein n=1 Tax=Brevibacillus TaxID=55080 RepID=UPI0020B2B03B|nr:recombinase family protein [Brevibacillus parabrevis]MED2254675.1 recombinase family protein [Brevibacillus parabrevis]WDV94075.1 recombinase family protein [Brevibacillus parabrevis]